MDANYEHLESVVCKTGKTVAQEAASSDKINEIDKALGVLSSDGVYAYYVYVKSKNISNIFLFQIAQLMKYTKIKLENNDYESFFAKLCGNLYELLFFKEILEQTLIYARYHAKARG